MRPEEKLPVSAELAARPLTSPQHLADLEENKWGPARRRLYGPDRERTVTTWRLADVANEPDDEIVDETINEMHGVDFLNDVIPALIRRKQAGSDSKVRILDMGCGVGFFGDQVRARFGDAVEVYGTSIVNRPGPELDREMRIKKAMVESMRSGKIKLPDGVRERILSEVCEDMHANDSTLVSILEMDDKAEFDLMIDSAGEMFYAGKGFFPHQAYSDEVFSAAVKKLRPGGQFYIGRLQERDESTFLDRDGFLQKRYGVTIRQTHKGRFGIAFLVTKPE